MSDACPKCGTVIQSAPGIGPFCPNLDCDVRDNLDNTGRKASEPEPPKDEAHRVNETLKVAHSQAEEALGETVNQVILLDEQLEKTSKALKVAREALDQYAKTRFPVFSKPANDALRQIKEIMGEK